MGADWPIVRLGDHVDACLGKMLDKNKNQGTPHPYLGNKQVRWGSFDLDDLSKMKFQDHEHDRYGLKPGDLVVCEGGEPGRCAIWKSEVPDMKIQKALHRIRPHNGLDSTFLHYWFCFAGKYELLDPYFTGTTIKHLTGRAIAELPIPLPPLPEQKAIAHILGTLDDKIELNRKMNATLEAMAQALFKSWFNDFDPVIDNILMKNMARNQPSPNLSQGERDGSSPTGRSGDEGSIFDGIPEPLQARAEIRKALGDQRKCLPDEIQKQFPDRFVFTEEMGWIPEGWEVSSVGDEVEAVGGGTPSTKEELYWHDGVHAFCTPKDMSKLESFILTGTDRRLTDAGINNISSGLLPAGALLMSSRAPIGYLAISEVPVSVNQGVIALLPNDKYEALYLFCWCHFNMGQVTDRANGSTFLEISKKNFRPIPFLVPSSGLLKYFNIDVQPIYARALLASKNINDLSHTRSILLPKLLSGELRIGDAENPDKMVSR